MVCSLCFDLVQKNAPPSAWKSNADCVLGETAMLPSWLEVEPVDLKHSSDGGCIGCSIILGLAQANEDMYTRVWEAGAPVKRISFGYGTLTNGLYGPADWLWVSVFSQRYLCAYPNTDRGN
jgi:hypothetical protein